MVVGAPPRVFNPLVFFGTRPGRGSNSIPPERVFSILNDTFDDDMDRSHADYIELSLQLQFNERTRECHV